MRFYRAITALVCTLVFSGPLAAQDETLADLLAAPAVQLSRPGDRARVVAGMAAIENQRRQNARTRATLLGLPLRSVASNGRVQEIIGFDGDRPRYFTTHNANAAISTGANLLRTSPYTLTGTGVTIGLWDGGSARATHQELNGRVTVMDAAASIDHATHVGGTLIASGIVASARGMASSATIDSYDWNNDATEMTSRGATSAGEAGKIYLSNHSYGYVSGWNYVNGGSPYRLWEWNGSGTTASSTDGDFGMYNTYTRSSDSLAYSAPYYLIFRSAGNDRSENPSPGQSVALAPGSATVVTYDPAIHPAGDGTYRGGYDTMGFDALAKNVLTIGSVADAVTSGIRDATKANISSFSSWGPTDDGRIKPDLVANGEALYSSINSTDSSYGSYNGTSMATPNSCGSTALLIQYYGNLFPGQAMRSSTLKGLLIHSADDRGNLGPDYTYGWGLMNVKSAADLIKDHQLYPAKQRITENQVSSTTVTRTHSFIWDGTSPIVATLCWTDPAGGALSTPDTRTPRLINNLNLKIIAPDGSTTFLPYVMPFVGTWTQASMATAATTGINNTDNVEQVRIAAPPAAGTYQAVVSFSGTLTNNSQNYSLILSGSSTDAPPPSPLALTSVSPNSALPGTVTLDITGTGLSADTAIKLTRTGQTNIIANNVQLIGEALRCQVNLSSAAAGVWNLVATKPNSETSTLNGAFTVIGAIWSENFDASISGWSSDYTGSNNSWSLVTTSYHSATTSYFAAGPAAKSTTNLATPNISIPAGATNLQLKFWHNWDLQNTRDCGKLEFSINNDAWFDVISSGSGAVFASNGYNATIASNGGKNSLNEFAGQLAWSGNSNGFVQTIVNLTDSVKYAGKNLRLRWRLATDNKTASTGWYVDDVVLQADGDLSNQAPSIVTAASTSSPETETDLDSNVWQILRSTSTNLSVLGADDGGESALTYTWSASNSSNSPVYFSANASNAAKNTSIYFEATGDYQISVSVMDAKGLAVTSTVNARVKQAASGLMIDPASATLTVGGTRTFSAILIDQFTLPVVPQPTSFTWTASGGGTINSSGLFTATTAGGPYTITATGGGFSNNSSVSVNQASATITLENLSQTYDGTAKAVSYSTTPTGRSVEITYDGSSSPPVNPGTYAVVATVTDPNYQGSSTGSLVISLGNNWPSWCYTYFSPDEQIAGLALDSADPDHDLLVNLAEYALGTDPRHFSTAPVSTLDQNGLSITFTRPANLPGITYAAESSSDLDHWSPVLLELLQSGSTETMRARDTLSAGDLSRRFLRLCFERH